MSVNTTTEISELVFFSSVFWMKYVGGRGCVFYTRDFMKEQRLVRGAYMCGMCFTSPIRGKNMKHCLEMSVNNS